MAGPLVVLLLLFASALFLVAAGRSTEARLPTAATARPLPSATVKSGFTPFPDLTSSRLRTALTIRGFTCDGPQLHAILWTTTCRDRSGQVVATGTDADRIDVVTAMAVGSSQASRTDEATRLFDATVRSACPPTDAAEMTPGCTTTWPGA